jgi:formate dehydrogenase subunit gamma
MAKTSKTAPASGPAKAPASPAEVKALSVCAAHDSKPENLLEIFHDVQDALGCVPEEALPVIANALNLTRAEVYGVMSFYHDFKSKPGGRHVIKICRAEACQSMGTEKLCAHAEKKLGAAMGGVSSDGLVSLEEVFCLGNCALSPAVLVGDRLYGKVDSKRFDEIIAGLEKEAAE